MFCSPGVKGEKKKSTGSTETIINNVIQGMTTILAQIVLLPSFDPLNVPEMYPRQIKQIP